VPQRGKKGYASLKATYRVACLERRFARLDPLNLSDPISPIATCQHRDNSPEHRDHWFSCASATRRAVHSLSGRAVTREPGSSTAP
jgi:hypothetical protein